MPQRHPWQPRTADIPSQPGVYRFLDARGRVIYVGKAKALRSRLTSYFQKPEALHERTRRMVGHAASVDWTVVPTERQALQLEYSWIKEFQPEFNIRFRDDKAYPYLVLTLAEDVPRVFLARRKGIKGARYFGPFPNAGALRDTLSTILKAFPVRSCSSSAYAKAQRAQRPCLLGDIGKCAAPCVERVSPQEHKALAVSLAAFMSGHDDQVAAELTSSMEAAAQALEHVGLPEAQLHLAHAAIYLALAPKSNRSAVAIWTARADVRDGAVGEVPPHLRDAHYRAAASLGHGTGYDYPHDHASGTVAQQYLPDAVRDRRWYSPSANGAEAAIGARMSHGNPQGEP